MDPIPCIFLTPTTRCERLCYVVSYLGGCGDPGSPLCCVSRKLFDEVEYPENTLDVPPELQIPVEHPDWPLTCDKCGKRLDPASPSADTSRETTLRRLYRRSDDGSLLTLYRAPVGAMWYADQMILSNGWYRGPDGHCLVVRVPGPHDWCVDARARNCDRQDDDTHRCWVRHGEPPLVTVDKNGETCGAGAGSILVPNWHGHLIDGKLVSCG